MNSSCYFFQFQFNTDLEKIYTFTQIKQRNHVLQFTKSFQLEFIKEKIFL